MTRLTPGVSGRGSWLADSQHSAASSARRQLAAGAAVAIFAAEWALAPVTAGLTVILAVIGRIGRWRSSWLLVPGSLGGSWVLQAGASMTWAGFLAGPQDVLGYLTAHGGMPDRVAGFPAVVLAWRHALAGQAPVAIVAAAVQVALLDLASGLAGSGRDRRRRPGVIAAARSGYLAWALRRGEVATADGVSLGVRSATGQRAAISWCEAAGGVVLTGEDPAAVTATGLDFLAAAIAHRKAVIAVDLTGRAIARARDHCARAGLWPPVLGTGSESCYQPWDLTDPDRVLSLVEAMLDWTSVGHGQRRLCTEQLGQAIRSLAARPRSSSRAGLLDQLIDLLDPSTLSLRGDWSPRMDGSPLAAAAADPDGLAPLREQLGQLGASALAGSLRRTRRDARHPAPAAGDVTISLDRILAGRGVALFDLDRPDQGLACDMIARLVAADLTELLVRQEWPSDCLIWINGCEPIGTARLAELVRACGRTRTPLLLSSADGPTVASLMVQANAVIVRGQAPASMRKPSGQAEQEAAGALAPEVLGPRSAAAVAIGVRGPRRLVLDAWAVR